MGEYDGGIRWGDKMTDLSEARAEPVEAFFLEPVASGERDDGVARQKRGEWLERGMTARRVRNGASGSREG